MITTENKTIIVEVEPKVITVEVTKGKDGKGVPAGGTAGQVLKKVSATDYDTEWSSSTGVTAWGAITGTLSQQEDLYDELDSRPTEAELGALAFQDSASLASDVTGTLPVANGGTGATTAAGARTALELGALATAADAPSDGSEYVRKNGAWAANSGSGGVWGSITGTLSNQTDLNTALSAKLESVNLSSDVTGALPIANGGTGATTAMNARAALGLGAMATAADAPSNGSEYVRKNGAWAVNTGSSETAVWGSITGTLSNQTDLSTALSAKANSADLGALATAADAPTDGSEYVRKNGAWAVNSGGSGGGVWGSITGTLSDQTDLNTALSAKLESVDLTTDVTGILPVANGGTGANTAAGALSALGAMAANPVNIILRGDGTALPVLMLQQDTSVTAFSYLAELAEGRLHFVAINGLYYGIDTNSPILTGNASGLLPLTKGGTGASTDSGARTNLGLGDLAVKDSVDLTADVASTVLPVENGGTGADTVADARTNLGLGDLAVVNFVSLSSGQVSGTLPIVRGGTGLNTSPSMLVNLASSAAADVLQASPLPGVTGKLQIANGGTGANTASGARTNLGLGDIACRDHVDLTSDVEGALPIYNGGTGSRSAADARTALELGDLAVKDSVDLTADVASTVLPVANGGTGAATAAAALTALGAMAANPAKIELTPSSSANYGGFIDFHYAGSTADYTARIIEYPQNTLMIVASAGMTLNGTPVLTGSYTTGTPSASSYITSNNTIYYRFGNVVIVSFSIQVTGLTSTSGNIDSNLLLLSGLPNAKAATVGIAFENNNASYYRLRVKVTTSGTLVTRGNQATSTYLTGAMYSGQLIYFCED